MQLLKSHPTQSERASLDKTDILFQKLFFESQDILIIYDMLKDQVIEVNDATLALTGYRRDEFMQLKRKELTPQFSESIPGVDLHKEYIDVHTSKVLNNETIRERGIFIDKLHNEIFIDVEIIPTGRHHGEAIIIAKDLTNQHKESELKYKNIVDSTRAGITIVNLEGKHIYASPNTCEITGYTVEEMSDMPVRELFPKKSREILKEYTSMLLSGIQPTNTLLLESYHKSGKSIWIQGSGVLVKDSNGKPYGVQTIFQDISDKVYLQEQISRTNEKYQRILENLDGLFITVGMNGNIEYVSNNFTDSMGYTQEEVIGRSGLFAYSKEHAALVKKECEKILSGIQESFTGTFKLFRKDGTETWFTGTFSLTNDNDGEPNGFVSVFLDVTEQKKLEQDLTSSKNRNNYLFNSSIEPIIVRDLHSLKLRDYNQAALDFFNLNDKSNIQDLSEFTLSVSNDTGESFEEIMAAQVKLAEDNNASPFRVTYTDPNDNRYIFEVNLVIDRSSPEEPNCVLFLKDITHQALTFDKINQERELLHSVLEGIQDLILVEDTNRKVLAVNSNFRKGFINATGKSIEIGEEMEVLLDANITTKIFGSEESRQLVMDQVLQGKSVNVNYNVDYKAKKYHMNLNTSPLKDKLGNVTGLISVLRDVTELVEKNNEIADKNIELQKYIDSNIQLENFAYIASHDLKQPLRTIMSFSELLQDKKSDQFDKDANMYISFIRDSAKRLDNLVNDMLAYSVIGTNGKKEKFNIETLIMQIIHDLDAQIKQTNTTIEIKPLPSKIFAFKSEISSLFLNIISNAIKYSKADTPPIISICAIEDVDHWKFSIKDNGIGISEKHIDKIFGMFQRLETHDEASGTGIGLAHCKKIIELHDGSIWVESEVGVGSNFIFTLPKK